ncbi:hypothetical protein BZA05DRAFT_428763 [Tricharina praecox]|uniref:uncharacterized protein n=1 Tax=Tricharina praecox TaxID=43433 RepID=UPI0022204AD6|nr:uncharacterized protein BZA05DRAFT_428763 [Tricharina praecox]KAI5856248.1 hypothetical protein BZA05DRAFT_428763 [Tricharina praecox]
MAAPTQKSQPQMQEDELLKRPLYVYDLPTTLLTTLTLKSITAVTAVTAVTPAADPEPTPTPASETPGGATSCALCSITTPSVQQQRQHYRSDLHRFNTKLKARGQPAVGENEFERLLEQQLEGESISGSESSDEEEGAGADDEDRLVSLVRRKAVIVDRDGEGEEVRGRRQTAGNAPIVWFSSSKLEKEVSLGVYRALFPRKEVEDGYLDALKGMQLQGETSPHVFMCMIGGGHFAAMVVGLAPKAGQGGRGGEPVVLAHKTFHRYTTRRKQGGSQSANDNAKGAAHSAGASIRRHNEMALTAEVRELLAGWKEYLDTAELLFVRATGMQNRRTLFGYEDAPMKSNDPRIRGFPFSTRRATQSELTRCFTELTRVKISRVDEAALAAAATAALAPQQQSKLKPASPAPPQQPKLSPEDEAALLHTTQLIALIRRSKASSVVSYLSSNKLPAHFAFFPPSQHHHSPTPLHLAASLNHPAVVTALLTKASADPTLKNADGKTPFLLTGDRQTRDTFRIARGELGEEKWQWELAAVPAPLKRAEVEQREALEKAEEKARREREVARLKEEEKGKAKGKVGIKSMSLGSGGVFTGLGRMEEESRGLTPEARMRLDRERRARAAEERMRKARAE